jgi:hypothetical protein
MEPTIPQQSPPRLLHSFPLTSKLFKALGELTWMKHQSQSPFNQSLIVHVNNPEFSFVLKKPGAIRMTLTLGGSWLQNTNKLASWSILQRRENKQRSAASEKVKNTDPWEWIMKINKAKFYVAAICKMLLLQSLVCNQF